MRFREQLIADGSPYLALTEAQLAALEAHFDLPTKWNSRLNLTRITNLEEVVQFHNCESLFLGTVLPEGNLRICDLGSGAGFPGIPLAITRQECEITLLEADQRKAVFLREAARNLRNVCVAAVRAEAIRESFDWVVSRAVAVEDVLSSGLADNFALLLGGDGVPPGSSVIRVPWGRDRVVAMVSRGTSAI